MIQVRRLGHVTLETPDVQRQADYYAEVIGLLVLRDGERAILSSALGEEVVIFTPGSAPRCTTIALQVAPATDHAKIDAALREHGVKTERRSDVSPSLFAVTAFSDPKGTEIELYTDARLVESRTIGGLAVAGHYLQRHPADFGDAREHRHNCLVACGTARGSIGSESDRDGK